MPTEAQLIQAEQVIDKWVRLADEVGVWYGSRGPRDGASANGLQQVFRFYARLAQDFPEDTGRVGAFISDVLVPGLLRACDATRRDLDPTIAGNIEPIIGELFLNRMAMEQWAPEVERRIIEGQARFTNLYWARTRSAGCPEDEVEHSRSRYESVLAACRETKDGCDPRVVEGFARHLRFYEEAKESKKLCRPFK